MNDTLNLLSKIGIVPVISISDASKAVPLAKALMAGGINAAEITFRTAAAEDAIKAITRELPDMLVGAGTVLDCDTLDRAVAAGAKFIVAPGFNPAVVKHALAKGFPMLPGVATGGEIEAAMALGLKAVKFFPAEASGGAKAVAAYAGPYRDIKIMPTGNITPDTMMGYLSLDSVLAVGGSWMVKKELIEGERWDEITAICRATVEKMLGFTLAHVGVNCDDEKTATELGETVSGFFGFAPRYFEKSVFAGYAIEYMKNGGPGTHGHIGFFTNSVERAIYHLERRGVKFDRESITYNEKGAPKFVYIAGEFGGFRIHILNK